MKFKKTAIALVLAAFAFSLAAPMTDTTVFAAKGGARISAPKAAPSTSKASPSTGATKASSPNTKEYAPSKSAKSYSNEAPSAKTGANAAAAQTQSGSRWGSALRNIGLFAGGMMLGGLLSNMFGMGGTGMMSDILGLLMNLVMIGAVVMIVRLLWNKFRGNKTAGGYREARSQEAPRERMMDVTPRQEHQGKVVDILPPAGQGDYDPRRTADRYRNR